MLSEVHMHDCTLLCIGAGVMQTGHVDAVVCTIAGFCRCCTLQ